MQAQKIGPVQPETLPTEEKKHSNMVNDFFFS